jgi:IS5 family transposase
MAGQGGFFDAEERLRWRSASGDPLERQRLVVDIAAFRADFGAALPRADRSRGGRPPCDAAPDAKTIRPYREQLTRAGALARLFARFAAMLAERGFLTMGGPSIDTTVVEARRPRLTEEEKASLRDGVTPAGWSKARERQIDRDGRWTLKRWRKTMPPEEGSAPRQAAAEIAVPAFGYRNRLGIDRGHGFIRRFTVTHAARHDDIQRGAVLDPDNTAGSVWADTAYRSKANLELLERRGLRPGLQRAKPGARPMPAHISRGNASRARVRSLVERVFDAEKRRMGLVVCCVGLVRATAQITLANPACNMRRLVSVQRGGVPA